MQNEKTEALQTLQKYLQKGDTVYTVLRHCAPSGMTRWLDLYVIKNGEPLRLTWSAAKALGYTYDRKREALKIGGCGMDMGFAVVYDLAAVVCGKSSDLSHRWL